MLRRTVVAALLFYSTFSIAQTKLTNFNYQNEGEYSSPYNFFEFNNELFFVATNDKIGGELWKTDGTAAGCEVVKDINLGESSSIVSNFLKFKNRFYFMATDGIHDHQLWESDGTPAGTKRITSTVQQAVTKIVATDDFIFFLKISGGNLEVWRSDGTAEGTMMVKGDIPVWNTYANLTAAFGKIFFSAQPYGENDSRVWRSDGTYEGTFPITELLNGNGSDAGGTSHPTQFIEFNGALYFISRGAPFTSQLSVGIMKTDGTVEGTVPVKGIHPGNTRLIRYGDVIVHNGKMYFLFFEMDQQRCFIWSSAGTDASTVLEYEYSGSDYFSPSEMTPMGSKIYFTSGNAAGGTSLIQFDPVTHQSEEIKQVAASQPEPNIFTWAAASKITSSDSKLFLAVCSNAYSFSFDLWSSNGSAAGTLKLPVTITDDYFVFKDELIFSGRVDFESELYKSDGSVAGTALLKDLNPSTYGLVGPSDLYQFNNVAIFSTYDSLHGYELWKTNGTASGTGLFKDILPGKTSSNPREFMKLNNKLFFTAAVTGGNRELFVSDGTVDGTKAITNLQASGKMVDRIIPFNETAFFFTTWSSADYSNTLYLSDGTEQGVTELINFGFNKYGVPFFIEHVASTSNTLYLIIEAEGSDLWKSDGTKEGTGKVADFLRIDELAISGNQLFFVETTNVFSGERFLRKSNGTPGGTVTLKALNPGLTNHSLFAFDNKVFFEEQDEAHGKEIWVSDGTVGNTSLLKDVSEGPSSSLMSTEFRIHNNALYFTAATTGEGSELWKTNGTTEGTTLVSDILPGPDNSKPYSLVSTGGRLYFTAYTPQTGFEIWSTNGDANDTRLKLDVVPGETYSNPFGYMDLNGNLLFYATTLSSGLQLYSANIVTGFEEVVQRMIEVYPNPSRGVFNLDLVGMDGVSLSVLNATGQCVYAQSSLSGLSQVDLGNFPSGLYIFQCKKGDRQYAMKVIKQ